MSIRKTAEVALLIAVGLILFVVESYAPRPLPWVKLGLGNIATVLALLLYGSRAAFEVTVVRVTLGSLFVGVLFGPAFLLALGGGLAAAGMMSIVRCVCGDRFSAVGLSIWGALGHNGAQVVLAYLLLVRSTGVFSLIPMFLLSSVLAGGLIGLLAHLILRRLGERTPSNIGYLSAT